MSLSASLSSDSDAHFDTPEAATPVHAPPIVPGDLEINTDADGTGEAADEQEEKEQQTAHRHKHGSTSDCCYGLTEEKLDGELQYIEWAAPLCEVAMETGD